jgi:hypothetical protein
MVPDDLPARAGERPHTTSVNPHTQLDQNAPIDLQDRLRDYALSLPGVRGGPSNVSVPGAVAFFLDHPPPPPPPGCILGGGGPHQRWIVSSASGATSIRTTTAACT